VLLIKRSLLILFASVFILSEPSILDEQAFIYNVTPVSQSYLASSRFTQPDDDLEITSNPYIHDVVLTKVSDNDALELHVDETNLAIYVYQKARDYWWSSTVFRDYAQTDDDDQPRYPELFQEGDRGLNSTLWRNRVHSPVWIGYFGGSSNSPQYREESLFDSTLSTYTFTTNNQGFSSQLYFAISDISMTLEVTLTDTGLIYNIDAESIIEHDDTLKLADIAIYPFFGAAKKDVIPGYIMVPDGIGTLFRFEDHEDFNAVYEKSFYGTDYAVRQPSSTVNAPIIDVQPLTANAYGMVHGVNQQGFLTIVDGAPEYARLVVYPAGVTTDFYFAYTSYTLRSSFRQPLNQSQTNTILRVQEELNPVNIHQITILLDNDDANYVGMANHYQSYLQTRGDITTDTVVTPALHLDILMSESERAFIGRDTFVMTHVSDVITFVEALQTQGAQNIVLTLRGTSSNGYSGTSLQEFPVASNLGSNAQFESLFNIQGLTVLLYVEPTHIYTLSSQSRRYDTSVGRHLLTYRFTDRYGTYDMIHPESMLTTLESLNADALAFGFDGLALDTIGHTLYSSFGNQIYTRASMKDAVRDVVSSSGTFMPYDYSFTSTYLFNVIADHSMYQSMKDTVPFLTYALAGYKDVFGRYHNFFGNTTNELLRMIDFRMMPSFIVTKESAYQLLQSPSSRWYTTSMSIWEDEIIRQYTLVSDALSQVASAQVIRRIIPMVGLSLVTYSNDITLGINYLDNAVTYMGITYEPMQVKVIGGPS